MTHQRNQQANPLLRRLRHACLAGGLTIALGQAPAVLATGLGTTKGDPVVGERLTLEIEVIEPNRLSLECFELKPVAGGEDRYFPRRSRLALIKTESGKAWLTIHGEEVREPIIEFRLTALCGAQISRDYTLLASPSRELRYELPVSAPTAKPVAKPVSSGVEKPAAVSSQALLPVSSLTLDQLARQRYPLQPKAREKFKRMVRSANADLLASLADEEAMPVAPEVLHYPDNLPKRRYGPYIPPAAKKKAPPPETTASESEKTPPPPPPAPAPAPQAKAEEPANDKLVIGTGGSADKTTMSPAEAAMAEKAEASIAAQEDMVAKLAQAENAYKELKDQLTAIENRMAALEQEKERLKREADKQANGAVTEFVVAILIGGLLGALLMIALRRRKSSGMPVEIGDKL